eukprot:Nk52_evm5s359 gene=Nk52_evmTU5s359
MHLNIPFKLACSVLLVLYVVFVVLNFKYLLKYPTTPENMPVDATERRNAVFKEIEKLDVGGEKSQFMRNLWTLFFYFHRKDYSFPSSPANHYTEIPQGFEENGILYKAELTVPDKGKKTPCLVKFASEYQSQTSDRPFYMHLKCFSTYERTGKDLAASERSIREDIDMRLISRPRDSSQNSQKIFEFSTYTNTFPSHSHSSEEKDMLDDNLALFGKGFYSWVSKLLYKKQLEITTCPLNSAWQHWEALAEKFETKENKEGGFLADGLYFAPELPIQVCKRSEECLLRDHSSFPDEGTVSYTLWFEGFSYKTTDKHELENMETDVKLTLDLSQAIYDEAKVRHLFTGKYAKENDILANIKTLSARKAAVDVPWDAIDHTTEHYYTRCHAESRGKLMESIIRTGIDQPRFQEQSIKLQSKFTRMYVNYTSKKLTGTNPAFPVPFDGHWKFAWEIWNIFHIVSFLFLVAMVATGMY